jgi:hypothetical protein
MSYKSDFKRRELEHELYWGEAKKRLHERNRKIEEKREHLKKERAKQTEEFNS